MRRTAFFCQASILPAVLALLAITTVMPAQAAPRDLQLIMAQNERQPQGTLEERAPPAQEPKKDQEPMMFKMEEVPDERPQPKPDKAKKAKKAYGGQSIRSKETPAESP